MNESVCVTSGAQMPMLEIDVALREQISPKSLLSRLLKLKLLKTGLSARI
jgi:hypothetical protein